MASVWGSPSVRRPLNCRAQFPNIIHPTDIAGTYSTIGAGAAIVAGGGAVTLQNAKGVVLTMQGVSVGLDFSINLSGVTINLR